MNAKKLLSLWGLKWNPFSPELPSEALLVTAKIESFAWRVEQLVQEGGFALISGESGTGKSVALRIVAERLSALRDVVVGVVERPQSKSGDFYRELGDIFSVKLSPSNRWSGFKALRERWKAHVASARIKPRAADRRGPGDELRGARRTAVAGQRRLRRRLAVDGGPLRGRAAAGAVAAGGSRSPGDEDPHAACHRARLARGTRRTARPRPGEGRQRHAHDDPTPRRPGRPLRRQLPPADDHGRRTAGLRHGAGSGPTGRKVLPGVVSSPTPARRRRKRGPEDGLGMQSNRFPWSGWERSVARTRHNAG